MLRYRILLAAIIHDNAKRRYLPRRGGNGPAELRRTVEGIPKALQ